MSSNEEFVIWEPEYNHRGTFSILLNCFTTLGICVWSSLHLNIPKKRPTWRQNLTRKMFWMSVGVLVPEFLVYFAFCQYLSAREIRDKVNEKLELGSKSDRVGGDLRMVRKTIQARQNTCYQVLVKWQDGAPSPVKTPLADKDSPLQNEADVVQQAEMGRVSTPHKYIHRWTMMHGFYAVMGGFVHQSQNDSGKVTRMVISSRGFIQLVEKRPDLIPNISEEKVCDKGKSDGLAKSILALQVGWFCINCIGRLVQHLPLTLLEVSTVAHAACSLFVYALWWDKPLNVADTMDISYAGIHLDVRDEGLIDREGNDRTEKVYDKSGFIFVAVFIMVAGIYGAPHFLAWNSSFATQTERLLWRICTCAVVGAPIFLGISLAIIAWEDIPSFLKGPSVVGFILSVMVYFPANLYIIAASLRQLFHLPPAAFKLPLWSNYFPHFS